MATEEVDPPEVSSDISTEKKAEAAVKELSPDLTIKHPLEHKWSLWFYKNEKNKLWEQNLQEITSFDTVEDFWALYNHIEVASKLPVGCDYSLFKYGIKPMWEDAQNRNGGRWLINLPKNQRAQDLDTYWLETLLCLIGEAFDEFSDNLCGAVVQIRPKAYKLGIWTGDAKNNDGNMKIGRKIKERLNMPVRNQIGYEAHSDTQNKSGSMAKNMLTI